MRTPQEYLRTAKPEEAARLAAIDAELILLITERRKLSKHLSSRWHAKARKFKDALGPEAGIAALRITYPASRISGVRHG